MMILRRANYTRPFFGLNFPDGAVVENPE